MSAWIVSKEHIDALVLGLATRNIITCKHEDCEAHPSDLGRDCRLGSGLLSKIGQELWRENHRSINARYNEKSRTPKYEHEPIVVDGVTLLKQVACYEYQSCEHDGWQRSKAHELMRRLTEALNAEGFKKDTAAYNQARWGL